MEELKAKLEQYTRYCDDSIPLQMFIYPVARLIMARSWLVVHFPLAQANLTHVDTDLRDQLFSTSIEVLEFPACFLETRILSNGLGIRKRTYNGTHLHLYSPKSRAAAEPTVRPRMGIRVHRSR